jgi:hypothetical protein
MIYSGLQRAAKTVAVIIFFTASIHDAQAQRMYQISLSDFKIDTNDINFTVSEIIDGRKDKNSLGIIQTGLNNKRNFAVFEKPGLSEIEDLLKNSGLYSQRSGLSLRITSLKISENALSWKETAKAELNIDFFILHEDRYYYVTSVFASAEPKGLDVTGKQDENIVDVIADALIIFSRQKNEVSPDRTFTKEELLDPSVCLRDPLSMPIIKDQKFKDGYYANFEEFVANNPSIDIDCKIKFSSPVKTVCGEQVREVPTLFGFAHQNKLYILYHHQFFELEKRHNTFFFDANPRLSKNSPDDVTDNDFTASAIAGMFDSSQRSSFIYMLDIKTGTVKGITGF